MLMKIKNKMMLGMDKVIKRTTDSGGIPACILLDPQEAVDFLKEIRELKIQCKKHIRVEHKNNSDIDMRFVLHGQLTKEKFNTFIVQWYNREILLYYKGIKLQVVKKKKPVPPPKDE